MRVPLKESLRFRIPVLVLTGVVPLMLLAIFYAGHRATKSIRKQAEANISLKGNLLADSISNWNRSNILAIENLSKKPDIIGMDRDKQQSILAALVQTNNNFNLALTIDLDGKVVATSDSKNLKSNYKDQEYFQKALLRDRIAEEIIRDNLRKKLSLCLAKKIIRSQSEGVVGVAVLCTNLKAIAVQLGELGGKTGYDAFVVDDRGRLLARSESSLLSGNVLSDFSQYKPVESFLANKTGEHSSFLKRGNNLVYYTTEIENGWGVVVVQKEAEFFKTEREFEAIVLLVAVVTVLAVSTITWSIALRLLGPLERLINEAIAVADGQLTRQVEVNRKDEFGVLANSFNKMASQLKTSFSTIEQRIEKRTLGLKQAAVEAETANRAKDRFLMSISDELRTPLNSILGYTKIMLRDRNLEPDQILNLRIVRQSGSHLLTLINDILDFSKTQTTKIELYPDDLNLPAFLEEIKGIIEIRAREKGLLFESKIDKNIAAGVKSDAKRLRQILLNLLSNAVKFTYNGKVEFEVKIIDEYYCGKTKANKQKILFKISDTGVGINQEQIDKLFQPFGGDGETIAAGKGTGLGLSISKELVELMGGKIEVKSEVGSGSILSFSIVFDLVELDIEKQAKSETKIIERIGYKGKARQILVVDDRSANRSLLKSILERLGFKVFEANHGQQGLEIAGKLRPDIILTDILMPVKSGLMMVLELREMPEFKETPIVAISASNQEIMRKKSKSVGCNAFLQKPLDEDELLAQLEVLLNIEWVYQEVSLESRARSI